MNSAIDFLTKHAESGDKITIEKVIYAPEASDSTDSGPEEYLRISGTPLSFRFLAQVMTAFASGDQGESWHLHPKAAGNAHFTPESEIGIHLRLKSPEEEVKHANAQK